MTGEEANSFLDIAESFGGLSFPTPFDLAGVYIDSSQRNRGGVDSLTTREPSTPIQRFPRSHLGITEYDQPGTDQFRHAKYICFEILISRQAHLLIGCGLQNFGLVYDEKALFEEPRAGALDGVGTPSPDDCSCIGGRKFRVEAIGRGRFQKDIAMTSGHGKEEQNQTDQ